MKALSLHQPWATLIAAGAKVYETRSWPPPRGLIGQPLAIHAAKKVDKELGEWVDDLCYGQTAGGFALADRIERTFDHLDLVEDNTMFGRFGSGSVLPIGCVVATCRLAAAYQLGDPCAGDAAFSTIVTTIGAPAPGRPTPRLRRDDYGDYAPGRWAWVLDQVRAINPPIPAVGRQGVFDLPQGWMVP